MGPRDEVEHPGTRGTCEGHYQHRVSIASATECKSIATTSTHESVRACEQLVTELEIRDDLEQRLEHHYMGPCIGHGPATTLLDYTI